MFSNKLIIFFLIFNIIKVVNSVLFFPTNSAYGIIAAIAVPIDLPHRNVFFSYNFEANYNLPFEKGIPPYLNGFDENGNEVQEARQIKNKHTKGNVTQHKRREKIKREIRRESLLTRAHFYHILNNKFQRSGYEGEPCLLRLICEVNASVLGEVNGVLGTLVHILFSPSTSRYENLNLKYYQAEYDGRHDHCVYYEKNCQQSVLSLISISMEDIIYEFIQNK